MKRTIYIAISFLFAFMLSSCLENWRTDETENTSATLNIKLNVPEDIGKYVSTQGAIITLDNNYRGTTYYAEANAAGEASIIVERGVYNLSVNIPFLMEDESESRVMGSFKSFNAEGVADCEIKLMQAYHIGDDLIIKEVYFGGCKDDANKNYIYDFYAIIYNNSAEVKYLDGMVLSTTQDTNTISKECAWMGYMKEGLFPTQQYCFAFPGNDAGNMYPVEPGAEIIVATNAIDHVNAAKVSASVNLARPDVFAMWNEALNRASVPDTDKGVVIMDLIISNGNLALFSPSTLSPGFMLIRIPGMTPQEYIKTPGALAKKPSAGGATAEYRFMMVDKTWIIDGIEFTNASGTEHDRLMPYINSDKFKNSNKIGDGVAFKRKVSEIINGRVIYQDTNNTAEDFEVVEPSLKAAAE